MRVFRRCLVLSVVFFIAEAEASEKVYSSPDGKARISVHCKSEAVVYDNCTVVAGRSGKGKRVFSGPVREPKVRWLSQNLAEIRVGYGTQTWATAYYSPTRGVSRAFPNAMAADALRMLTVVPERAALAVYGIFDNSARPTVIVRRPYYAADVLAGLSDVRFLPNGGLSFAYRDANGNLLSEIIPIAEEKHPQR